MVPKKHAGEATTDATLVSADALRTGPLIITRADRGTWDECCVRVGLDPRERRIRHVTIAAEGIRVHIAKRPSILAGWGPDGHV
jgi:hypothetical protein